MLAQTQLRIRVDIARFGRSSLPPFACGDSSIRHPAAAVYPATPTPMASSMLTFCHKSSRGQRGGGSTCRSRLSAIAGWASRDRTPPGRASMRRRSQGSRAATRRRPRPRDRAQKQQHGRCDGQEAGDARYWTAVQLRAAHSRVQFAKSDCERKKAQELQRPLSSRERRGERQHAHRDQAGAADHAKQAGGARPNQGTPPIDAVLQHGSRLGPPWPPIALNHRDVAAIHTSRYAR